MEKAGCRQKSLKPGLKPSLLQAYAELSFCAAYSVSLVSWTAAAHFISFKSNFRHYGPNAQCCSW